MDLSWGEVSHLLGQKLMQPLFGRLGLEQIVFITGQNGRLLFRFGTYDGRLAFRFGRLDDRCFQFLLLARDFLLLHGNHFLRARAVNLHFLCNHSLAGLRFRERSGLSGWRFCLGAETGESEVTKSASGSFEQRSAIKANWRLIRENVI